MPTILITGASQGIGAAIAREFSREPEPDTQLILVARNTHNLESVAAECRLNVQVKVAPCDVTDVDATGAMAEGVIRDVGVPDVVVNNAGVFRPGGFLDVDVDDFRDQIDVNLTSAFVVSKAFLRPMVERQSGMFVFMASVASIRAYPGGVAYCAAKHGLLGLARVLREETREHGIRVTSLIAGATWTPSWSGSGHREERLMPDSDIARLVRDTWKLSDRSVVEEIVVRPQLGDL